MTVRQGEREEELMLESRRSRPIGGGAVTSMRTHTPTRPPVSKTKSVEIEKFERKKTGARAGVRHVS